MKFNKKEFENFRKDLEEALKEVEQKYSVDIHAGSISYSSLDFTMKLKVTKADEGIDVEKEKFIKECWLYGFKEEHYKAKFDMQGRTFELIGFNSRSPKNNCEILEVSTNKKYKTNDEAIKRALRIA